MRVMVIVANNQSPCWLGKFCENFHSLPILIMPLTSILRGFLRNQTIFFYCRKFLRHRAEGKTPLWLADQMKCREIKGPLIQAGAR